VEAAVDMLGLGHGDHLATAPTTRLILGTLVERSSTTERPGSARSKNRR